ncbi:MAG: phosphoribosylformylglycinamidine synthase subunit PurQ [Gemmatimonadetes bacterium]|nr:phosphoribosylformylglycinamidine synthase subunit PurQ [Gemmatimonadota bacterium]
MRVAIIRFPGSNCEPDAYRAVEREGGAAYYVFHRETDLHDADAVIIPGGFSYGDYLRAGAIARFSPIMAAIERHAADGKPLAGICNGFQVLCEAGLLPGALMRNAGLQFLSRPVDLRVERRRTPFTAGYREHEIIRIPIGHGDGRYAASEDVLATLESEGRVVFRYVNTGMPDSPANPNGAMGDIAAISNRDGNVVGMMPHPERLADPLLGSTAGTRVFSSLVRWKRPLAAHV